MANADELLENSRLTEDFILQELQDLAEYYGDMKLECRIVPAMEDVPLPTLLAVMEEDKGRPRFVTHSFLPLDTEDAEFTKFLQFYCELQNPVAQLPRETLLEALCKLNGRLPFGACFLVEPRPELALPRMVAIRALQGFPIEPPIDQGVFTEDVFLFDTSCTLVSSALDALAEGAGVDAAVSMLGG